ncbi:hypothetical protein [Rhizobacter sp. LjRoot28]|jgi:DnaJ like chaperone protein|uniref:hypothetical protein n=1 Tax=Rhizobacter sp. LjRoot28 TaxID=3342309 RepID=UPI003ECDEC6E
MTTVEWLVIGIGAAAGYWLIDFLLKGRADRCKDERASLWPQSQPEREGPQRDVPTSPDWSQVLAVRPDASLDEIRSARDRQLLAYDPHKVAELGPELRHLATEKSSAIVAAYEAAVAERGAT